MSNLNVNLKIIGLNKIVELFNDLGEKMSDKESRLLVLETLEELQTESIKLEKISDFEMNLRTIMEDIEQRCGVPQAFMRDQIMDYLRGSYE